MKRTFVAIAASLFLASSHAGDATALKASGDAPVLNLSASAKLKTPADEMVVVLSVSREGSNLGALNQAVLSELQASLSQAKVADGVTARLGAVSSTQTYSQQGKAIGWQVRGDVVLQSRKFKELGDLSGQLSQRMALSGVTFRLSSEKRAELEQRLMTEAATAFQVKARAASRALGYSDYALKELTVNEASASAPREIFEARMAAPMGIVAAVPAEGGETEVAVSLSGSVSLR